jgi:Na+/H+-dicarboxylate symporter
MARRGLFVTLVGGLALALLVAALVVQHMGVNETAFIITIGMLCGPAVAASMLVGACSLLELRALDVREG